MAIIVFTAATDNNKLRAFPGSRESAEAKTERPDSTKHNSKKVVLNLNRTKSKRSSKHYIYQPNPHPTEDDCVLTTRYTAAQRLKHYPFSTAVKIYAVSFRWTDRRRDYLIGDSVKIYDDGIRSKLPDSLLNQSSYENKYESGLHVENQKLNYSSLIELQELDSKQINKLTNLIFNTRVKKPNNYAYPGLSCYSPRNALVFYDKDGNVFDYLEICFECKHFESKNGKISIGHFCNQKYDLLRQFFIDLGIQYGTDKAN